jgi:tape measure domain-containing protein
MAVAGADMRQLLLQVDASVALAQRNLNQLAAQVQRDSTRMDQALGRIDAASDRVGRAFGGLRNVAAGLGVTLGAAGMVQGLRSFLDYADAAKTLEAQLRLATQQSGSFAQAQEDVRRIAAETRTGIEETASLYATFQRNSLELGISQEQAARATETVSKAFQISGASAAEAAGGLRQFLQGVQSGTLRGEELNSVLENAPRLARLLADSLGITIGQLRAMGQAGELTGDVLMRALTDRRFTDQIDAEFRELPVTFDQAMTQITNAATIAFGAFDRGGQFSQWLASFAMQGAESFASVTRDAELAGATIRSVFDGLGNLFDPMAINASSVFDFIRRQAEQLTVDLQAGSRAWADITSNWWRFGIVNTAAMRRGAIPRHPDFVEGSEGFSSAQQQSLRARTQNAGIAQAWQDQMRFYNRPGARPPSGFGGGAGGGRARGGGGGGRRGPPPRPGDVWDLRNSGADLRAYEAPVRRASPFPEDEEGLLSIKLYSGVAEQAVDTTNELGAAIAALPRVADILPVEDQRRLENFVRSFQEDLAGGLAEAIVYGEDLGDALVNTIQRAAVALIESSLMDLLTGRGASGGILGSLMGGGGGLLGSLFGGGGLVAGNTKIGRDPFKIWSDIGAPGTGDLFGTIFGSFGGFRAGGGEVRPGNWYMVGERGPEPFVPKVPGVIIPNHAMGGGGGAPTTKVFDLRGAIVTADLMRQLDGMTDAKIIRSAPVLVAAAKDKVLEHLGRAP